MEAERVIVDMRDLQSVLGGCVESPGGELDAHEKVKQEIEEVSLFILITPAIFASF